MSKKGDEMTDKNNIIEVLDVLACEIDARPRGAPTFEDVAPSITSVRRDTSAVVVEFEAAARDAVAELVAAERQCCSTIGWQLEDGPPLRLHITAQPGQLDVFEAMLQAS
jgi:hypothetical protein